MSDLIDESARRRAPCMLCGSPATWGADQFISDCICPRCGRFTSDQKFHVNARDLPRLAGWIRDQNDTGIEWAHLTLPELRRVCSVPIPPLRERADRALRYLVRVFTKFGAWYDPARTVVDLELLGRTYSANLDEVHVLIQILLEQRRLQKSPGGLIALSVEGLLAAEEMGRAGAETTQGFVAMSFDPSMTEAWQTGFHPAIEGAGFRPFRIDAKDFVGGISDEIMAEIKRARFVVADYTGSKAGVYFEAGYALGLGKVVIPTCREDEIKGLHFDIRHLNTLPWSTPADLADKLRQRIAAVVGTGPH